MRFHDGSLMRAADVVASLRRAALPNSPYTSVTHKLREVVLVDSETVDLLCAALTPC